MDSALLEQDPFAIEHGAMDRMRAELVAAHPGEYAVFRGEDLIGTARTHSEAFELGLRLLGAVRFMVEQISESRRSFSMVTILVPGSATRP